MGEKHLRALLLIKGFINLNLGALGLGCLCTVNMLEEKVASNAFIVRLQI